MKVLTVSVAAYNVGETLDEALAPFTKSKRLDDIEILIVNDGSKDNTAEIASRYVSEYPQSFRLINKENGGWGSTLNASFAEARGVFFKQLDGDDFYSEENLDDFIDYLRDCDADLVCCPYVNFENMSGGITGIVKTLHFLPQMKALPVEEVGNFTPAMHSVTVRTSILTENNIHITEKCFYTDVEYTLKSYNNSATVSFYPFPIYHYRLARDGQSMSIAGVRKNYRDHVKMLTTMLEYFDNEVKRPLVRENIELRLYVAVLYQYLFFMALKPTKEHRDEMRAFDNMIKEKYPAFYNKDYGIPVVFLRAHDFKGYGIVSRVKMMMDRHTGFHLFAR